jgi:ubiquitin-conjugating enzyme E2 M
MFDIGECIFVVFSLPFRSHILPFFLFRSNPSFSQIYHPNINEEGAVCLNILRQDWKPVLTLGSVIIGLMTLFLEPNPGDPLNHDAAKMMIEKPQEFERTVKRTLAGGNYFGRNFPKLL